VRITEKGKILFYNVRFKIAFILNKFHSEVEYRLEFLMVLFV